MIHVRRAGYLLVAATGPVVWLLVWAAVLNGAPAAGATPDRASAEGILEAAGVEGGLVVHLGCGDPGTPARMADLHAEGRCLVHGLDTDADAVRRAREALRRRGIYGPVAVDRFDGKRLPYADNLVNLLVAEDTGGVAMDEVMRVLAPGGAAEVGGRRTVKPHPDNTDEWTHFLHDASGNAVAHDAVVGPPRRARWIAAPRHTRSHEHIPSLNALVSAGGRIFYVADEGPIMSLRQPADWHLVARDAYNGVLLWKRAFRPWFPHIVNWGRTPRHLQRRLVADGDRLYVTLGLHAPLSVVDAATGETLKVYPQTRGTEEVLCHDGLLLLVVRAVTEDRVAEREKWARLQRQDDSPLFKRDSAEPLVRRFRRIESAADRTIRALQADTGRVLWTKAGAEVNGLRPETLCASGDRVFYQKGGEVRCVDLRTGRPRWSASAGPLRVVSGDTVVCAGGETVTALSAETGKTRWKQDGLLCQVRDAFVTGGSLWLGGFKPYKGRKSGKRGPAWGPYFAVQRDLDTGKLLKHVEPPNPGHHHRCWRNKATDRYILSGRRGVEFIDLATGDLRWHSWVRGVCRYGVMPANGLLYAPPHACGCYITAKLDGFYALAPAEADRRPAPPGEARLEKGPSYGSDVSNLNSEISEADWPTYRHDAGRSGCTPSPVPAALRRAWRVDLGGPLSAPTVAGGKVFVARVDAHTVCAVEAETGRPAWQFTAGARVDSPPTVHEGRALFGCRDGCLYGVRAADGALAWRLRAARAERRIAVRGQLESVAPVPGSVLVRRGAAYCTAGRSSYLDGGIDLYRVQPETGKVLSRTPIYSPDPETGRQPDQFGPNAMPGALADILTADPGHVYLRDMVFDPGGRRGKKGSPHLLTLTGFLDDTWPHRSYWIFGTDTSLSTGCSGRDRNLIYGRLLVFDKGTVYGYGRAGVHWSNMLQDGAYRLFALARGERKARWSRRVPIRVRAMVLAGDVLFAAGPPAAEGGPTEAAGDGQGARLLALSAADGSTVAAYPLEGRPVFDGMAAAGGRLYLAMDDGTVLCFGGR